MPETIFIPGDILLADGNADAPRGTRYTDSTRAFLASLLATYGWWVERVSSTAIAPWEWWPERVSFADQLAEAKAVEAAFRDRETWPEYAGL